MFPGVSLIAANVKRVADAAAVSLTDAVTAPSMSTVPVPDVRVKSVSVNPVIASEKVAMHYL